MRKTANIKKHRHVWAHYSMMLGTCEDICIEKGHENDMERTRKGKKLICLSGTPDGANRPGLQKNNVR